MQWKNSSPSHRPSSASDAEQTKMSLLISDGLITVLFNSYILCYIRNIHAVSWRIKLLQSCTSYHNHVLKEKIQCNTDQELAEAAA